MMPESDICIKILSEKVSESRKVSGRTAIVMWRVLQSNEIQKKLVEVVKSFCKNSKNCLKKGMV